MHPKDTPQLSLFASPPADLPPIVPIISKQIEDLTGQQFGRLVVLGYVGNNRRRISRWLCRCECGKRLVVIRTSLVDGNTQSCGCLKPEALRKANTSHNMTRTQEYRCWQGMIRRCKSTKGKVFVTYASRGITICDHWQKHFENFYADLGPIPSPKHSIDRIDTNGHYSCGHCDQCIQEGWAANCQWATRIEQANNTRRNHYVEFNGEQMTITQWARKLGMNPSTLYGRLTTGWSVEKALTTPSTRK